MEVPGPVTLGADELGASLLRLGAWSGIGFVLGTVSALGAYELYPPAGRGDWTFPALALVSLVVVAVLYATTARLGDTRSADWLVLGYTAALVLAAGLVVAHELLALMRDELPAVVWSEGFEAMRVRPG